jgi:hypothetical protein
MEGFHVSFYGKHDSSQRFEIREEIVSHMVTCVVKWHHERPGQA